MRNIPLTKGKFAIVDDADFDWLSQWKWYFHEEGGAARMVTINGKRVQLYMSRVIMNAPSNRRVDHVDRNNLDNRRSNIRLATRSQNRMNSKVRKDSQTGFKGVRIRRENPHRPYFARITKDHKIYHLGSFATAEEAALAYNKAAVELHGEFARLNHI